MADIKDLISYYPEASKLNRFVGNRKSGNLILTSEHLYRLFTVEKIEDKDVLLSYGKEHLRVYLTDSKQVANLQQVIEGAKFAQLVWLEEIKGNEFSFAFMASGTGQVFQHENNSQDSFEIGYKENIKTYFPEAKSNQIIETNLFEQFVFSSGSTKFLLVEPLYNKTKESFFLHSMSSKAEVHVEDQKWILNKVIKKVLSRRHEDFCELNLWGYGSIKFVEASKASQALNVIRQAQANGTTLLDLWERYSKIELERAERIKEEIGEISFRKDKHISEDVVRVEITNRNTEFNEKLRQYKSEIAGTALELFEANNADQPSDKTKRFKVRKVEKRYLELYETDFELPNEGMLSISTIGNKVVEKRRNNALRNIKEANTHLLRNTLLAIEGQVEALPDNETQKTPLTASTLEFLKEKFGIDDLTDNQKDAIRTAINTPDLAIIQGPPGTGKSTVVAALAHRLLELSKEEGKDDDGKQILVSAFQNDTVEHIASKIYSLGLPTIKLGKSTANDSRAEDRFIDDIEAKIDIELAGLTPNSNSYRTLKNIEDILETYKVNLDLEYASQKITREVEIFVLPEHLQSFAENLAETTTTPNANQKIITALKALRTDPITFEDDGYRMICKLLRTKIDITSAERKFLDDFESLCPEEQELAKLLCFKESQLEKYYQEENAIQGGTDQEFVQWAEEVIVHFQQKVEMDFRDDETFMVANLEKLREELRSNPEYIRESIASYGQSLAATNQIAGSQEMSQFSSIKTVLLEEAARSNPLDLLIPINKASERIILIGDQNQLPHLLENDIAEETERQVKKSEGQAKTIQQHLTESLFGILFRNLEKTKASRTITLNKQFRMHPVIGNFVSELYYNNELQTDPELAEKKKHGLSLDWAQDKQAVFCDVNIRKGAEVSKQSKARPAEAKRIAELLSELETDPAFENLSIGIITFYASQVQAINRELFQFGYVTDNNDGSYDIAPNYRQLSSGEEKLRVGTVDSFQGKEFDVVILSTVRSNNKARSSEGINQVFGFLTIANRLNVAFSRAQKLLVAVGDGEMFADEYAQSHIEGLYKFYSELSKHPKHGNHIV